MRQAEKYRFQFIAGNLALDFVNTVSYRLDPAKLIDRLQSADDVRRWADQAHLADRRSIQTSALSPSGLKQIRATRDQLFTIFRALANKQPVPSAALLHLGDALHNCCARRYLAAHDTSVRWIWRSGARGSDFLLLPILTAATDLLTSGASNLVRQCADEGCGWLFLDRSNARKRRWCRMADCGNRNKAREHYRRQAALV